MRIDSVERVYKGPPEFVLISRGMNAARVSEDTSVIHNVPRCEVLYRRKANERSYYSLEINLLLRKFECYKLIGLFLYNRKLFSKDQN